MLQLWFFANILLWQLNIEVFGLKLTLNVVLLAMLGAVWIWKRQRIATYSAKVIFAFAIVFLISYLAAIAGPCTDKFEKALLTGPALLFLTLVGLEVGWRATDRDWMKLQKVAGWILLCAFTGIGVEILLPEAFPAKALYREAWKFSGFYSEPSFVAYSLFPCVLILLEAQSKQLRRKGLLALCGLVLLSRSSTLLALITVWILYRSIKHRNLYMALGWSLVVGVGAILSFDLLVAPTLDRIVGVAVADNVDNVSSLVYLQGWQDAWENLSRTNGLGLGFNMMGCNPIPDVPARATVATVFNLQVNDEDGSAVLGKLISETGVFGLLFFIALVWWWIKKEKMLRGSSSVLQCPARLIQLALILSFVATALIRSPGYFSGSYFLLVVAVAAIVKWPRAHVIRLSNVQSSTRSSSSSNGTSSAVRPGD